MSLDVGTFVKAPMWHAISSRLAPMTVAGSPLASSQARLFWVTLLLLRSPIDRLRLQFDRDGFAQL